MVLEFHRTKLCAKHMTKILENTWWSLRWFLLLWMLALTGCGGCFSSSDEKKLTKEELEKKAKEQRESLEWKDLVSLPADSDAKFLFAKPGHWMESRQVFKSNREDLQIVAVNALTRAGKDLRIPGTNFTNEFTRRTSLPKGQEKNIDLQCFVPSSSVVQDSLSAVSTRLTFRTELLSYPLMTPILQAPAIKTAEELKDNEFQLVVLGPKPRAYSYLTVLDAIYWSGDELMTDERVRSYRVTMANPVNNKYALPKSLLTMTSIAVILWDDVDPDTLSDDQKRAIVDWVHWGGQIVVSGPSSWARLENSFLSPYLPAASASATELTSDSFASISAHWMTDDLNRNNPSRALEIVGDPISGVSFELKEGAQWLPETGQMVAENQVGRGRVVMTSFPLNDPQIFRWQYYSSFFSTGLLRRHPRTITTKTQNRQPTQVWTAPFQSSSRDARLHSNLRILTRDLPQANLRTESEETEQPELDEETLAGQGGDAFVRVKENKLNTPENHEAMQWGGRGAAWNDYSGMSFQAINALRSAAGIELPSRTTIIYLLGGYLLLLVPLNWAFFRVIGRLELAWIAAPVMAIAGALIVTKVARLDIGFARRTTEIAVLELHGTHDRGHLTQYLALYTSLSTNYAVQFPENDSVALPLGNFSRDFRRAGSGERALQTNYGRADGVTLEPLTVYSSSTEMLHAEQMVSLDGGLRLGSRSANGEGAAALKNDTGIDLEGALVLRRNVRGDVEMAWLGELASAQTATLDFKPTDGAPQSLWSEWDADPITQRQLPGTDGNAEQLWLGGVLKDLVTKTPLMPGQTRLFGYTKDRLGRLKVVPNEDQYDGCCLVVAHLTPQTLGVPVAEPRIRSRGKAAEQRKEDLENAVRENLKSSPDDPPESADSSNQ